MLAALLAATLLNPCSLLTRAQVSKAFGERSTAAQLQPSAPGHPVCGWLNASQTKTLYVTIASRDTMPPPWWKSARPFPVSGALAWWSSGWAYVKKHGNAAAIELILSPNSVKRPDPQLLAIAKAVAARMP
jgi:hypothetical protein